MASARTAEVSDFGGSIGQGNRAAAQCRLYARRSDLRDQLGDNVEMAKETEIDPRFPDCAHGAVRPLVTVTLPLIVDDSIEAQPEIHMEASDYETLLHMCNSLA